MSDPHDRLMAGLSAEQHRLFSDYESDANARWVDRENAIVDSLARHFGDLAPAIRATAEHVVDRLDHTNGPRCCEADPSA